LPRYLFPITYAALLPFSRQGHERRARPRTSPVERPRCAFDVSICRSLHAFGDGVSDAVFDFDFARFDCRMSDDNIGASGRRDIGEAVERRFNDR